MFKRLWFYFCCTVSLTTLVASVHYVNSQGIINPCTIAPSATVFGCVKPDGTTITNTAGAISTTYGTGANTAAQGNDARFGLKSKIITITRDLSVATGSVAYTGCGFQPTALVATGGLAASTLINNVFFSMADSSVAYAELFAGNAQIAHQQNFLSVVDTTATNNQVATVASYGADGFTLAWTKTGAPTGTADFYVMCLR